MQSPEAIDISKRFFQVLDALIAKKVFRGKKTFCDYYNINRGNLNKCKSEPQVFRIPTDLLAKMVLDHGASAHWLLTGQGEMFSRSAVEQKQPESDLVLTENKAII